MVMSWDESGNLLSLYRVNQALVRVAIRQVNN